MISKKQSLNKILRKKNKKKQFRKSKKQFKLRGGTYLNNNPNKIKIFILYLNLF